MSNSIKPMIVGLGGTIRAGSSSERALRICLAAAERLGSGVMVFAGEDLVLPVYDPGSVERTPRALRLVEALRAADAVILASPGYHGSVSGLLKNALDYAEDLRSDRRPYLDGRAVGTIVCAHGWQATGTTLVTVRSIVHALRGWPTPLGVTINSALEVFSQGGECVDAVVKSQLELLATQVHGFASRFNAG